MDTSVARRNILARIRSAQGRRGAANGCRARDGARVRGACIRQVRVRRCLTTRDELIARFTLEAERLSTTLPKSSRSQCTRRSRSLSSVAEPFRRCRRVARARASALGATRAFRRRCASRPTPISSASPDVFARRPETGSLVLLSGAETPASGALLPQTHIAIVPASRIVAAHEDAFALMRAERGELPRAVNFVSGPSRTGDIEQTIVLGAHGPYRVHVIIVRGA